ncbi:MAG: septum formation initiator family protein [Cyclobacteriaceae bacterium]|nr:septum formation initiator family protein [Cyclobacteriaceae bacterium]
MKVVKRLPGYLKNFYFLIVAFFLIWMLFIDSNDFYSQFKKRMKLNELEKEKEYYIQKISEVENDREELLSNDKLLEKFAREKYLMKKPTEDLFVIVTEE